MRVMKSMPGRQGFLFYVRHSQYDTFYVFSVFICSLCGTIISIHYALVLPVYSRARKLQSTQYNISGCFPGRECLGYSETKSFFFGSMHTDGEFILGNILSTQVKTERIAKSLQLLQKFLKGSSTKKFNISDDMGEGFNAPFFIAP